jgi:hypothetical protein
MPAALRLPLPATGCPAGIGWHERLVVPLRFSDDDGKEKLLLPHGRLTGAIKPSVGRLPRTTQSGNDHGGRIRGERISEGHGQILPQKKKYAMQKINLAKCPQCRQIACMSNTNHIATIAFFAATDAKTKTEILAAIAKHYGISESEALEEVTDEEAESLLDYLTGSIRTATSLLMKRHGIAA